MSEKNGEPVQEPVQDPVQDPVQEPVQDPVQDPVQEPVEEPVEGLVLEPAWDAMVNWSEAEREWWWMGPFAGQVPGLVRRIRRILDVSQRGLAALLGVSQSVVARWETGRTSPRARVLQEMLQMAGLRVGFTDAESGQRVEPMRADGARTHAGSRFPAHVDLRARGWWLPRRLRAMTSIEAWQWLDRSRVAREPAIGFCLSPSDKAYERQRWGVPDDHPAVHQFAAEVEWREEQLERRRQEIRRRHSA